MKPSNRKLIESDEFPFEFLSRLAERESWRKEVHRPIYHVHKWWAKRLGSVFRGILLGAVLPDEADLAHEFYQTHAFAGLSVLDPFMGSGTTIGEAHKLGMTALGRDINPVAVNATITAFGALDRRTIKEAFQELAEGAGKALRELYRSVDSKGRPCDVLYHFWVMQASCPHCAKPVDLFPSYIVARNASPRRKSAVQILCPSCGDIFPGSQTHDHITCRNCGHHFDFAVGSTTGARATCTHCQGDFAILKAVGQTGRRPDFRHYAKLVLTCDGHKEYLPANAADHEAFVECSRLVAEAEQRGEIHLPNLRLEHGHNTRQAMGYGFRNWRDFFNDRQLLALGKLHSAIQRIEPANARLALATLFSGVLEFNNLFASYKGEGTGAVRHMFSHHILKPERTPIEANVWGTPKSSGSFSNLFRGRLLRAMDYREFPTEVNGKTGTARVCSLPFTGKLSAWPESASIDDRVICLSCGDSADTRLPSNSVDLVVTDPPFFDNVHYSELADFFYAWQQLPANEQPHAEVSTRHEGEVQDADPGEFSSKLQRVFCESCRVLKDDGLMVFSYHHSREEGWQALAEAILAAGFTVVNAQPVKAEMAVATPKSQAKEPIQLDIIIVCRKTENVTARTVPTIDASVERARSKMRRLQEEGFELSRNDQKIILYGQLLASIKSATELPPLAGIVTHELSRPCNALPKRHPQGLLFEE